MKTEKEKIDPKKQLLYRLVQLIKTLYPNEVSENPYHSQLQQKILTMDLEDQILIHNLIHCITVLNKYSRNYNKSKIISSQQDNLNAWEMALPTEYQLKGRILEIIETLKKHFGYKAFEKRQAMRLLNISKTTFNIYGKILKYHGLLQFIGITQGIGKDSIYQLLEQNTLFSEAENIWQEAHQDYADFKGFEDLQYRTGY